MTSDDDLIAIIAQGITDGTDLDCTAETQAREVLRQLRAAGVMPQWQPIETAPKDGTRVLVWRRDEDGYTHRRVGVDHFNVEIGKWWRSRRDMYPTHWMPLPEAP